MAAVIDVSGGSGLFILSIVLGCCFTPLIRGQISVPLLMPDVQPLTKETYLCTGFKMPTNDHFYIVGFEPNATQHTAHHILIYGCKRPGYWERDSPRVTWDCGEMGGHSKSNFRHKPVCESGSQIIYAWAKDAPALKLPAEVGFKVGKGSEIDFLVLQVHYANVDKFLNGGTDDSGIVLQTLDSGTTKVNKAAGVYLLGTGGFIPSRSTTYMETSCVLNEDFQLHPFAFRTHTHKLGLLVSGYVKRENGTWERIGKHDPQKPQMFYKTDNQKMILKKGDILASRCTMKNYLNQAVMIGATANDEMCNFYMMYYVDGEKILDRKYCFSSGPPSYSWEGDVNLGQIPNWVDRDASTLN